MYARVSFYDMGNASRDDAARAFENSKSAIQQMQGNQGGMALVSASGDKAITITLWESEEAMGASEEGATKLRSDAAGSAAGTVQDL